MSRIGFVGLGVMGRPMAANLVRAGHDVVVHNRSRAAVEALVALGAAAAPDPAAVARRTDILITMLPDTVDVESVVLSPDGVLAGAAPGLLLIDMSTISPSATRVLAERAKACGVGFLDAPVSGGEAGAIDGTLSIMVGGSPENFAIAEPVFRVLGSVATLIGPNGAGQLAKAANQLIVAGIIELVSEAIVLLEATGVAPERALRALAGGLAGSRVLDRKSEAMLRRDFKPGFRIDLQHKDLQIALGTARDSGVVVPVTAVVAQLLVALRAAGYGHLDHGGILLAIQNLSGGQRHE